MLRCTKNGIHEIEPYDIRLQAADSPGQSNRVPNPVRLPAPHNLEAGKFLLHAVKSVPVFIRCPRVVRKFVAENREVHEGVALEFTRQVETVFVQLAAAGRKRCNQTNLHGVDRL